MPQPGCEPDAEPAGGRLPADDLPASQTDEVAIDYEREPPRGDPARRIHERMPTPPLAEGEDVPDRTPSPPLDI